MSARYYGWYDGVFDPEYDDCGEDEYESEWDEYESEWDEYVPDADEEEPDENFCPRCGKNYYDFSDYGCPDCDRRVTGLDSDGIVRGG